MARDREVDDGLSRWAAARAPALLARAEAEAVALLRDALLDAATETAQPRGPARRVPQEERRRPPQEERRRPLEPPAESEDGELTWAYCVLRAEEELPADLPGVDPSGEVRPVRSQDLIALVSSVPRNEFRSQALHRNLNDIGWLERVARAHERVLDATLQATTIVPLRLCTLYENDDGVREMLERERVTLMDALRRLEGRAEWAVKVLVDEERLMGATQASSAPDGTVEPDLDGQGEGGAYMLRRRLARQHRAAAQALASEVAQEVHAGLQGWAIDAVTQQAQNRELSGHQGEMVLNAAYLGARERVDELRALVTEFEARYRELGVRIDLTGPWPPYNFVSTDSSAAVA